MISCVFVWGLCYATSPNSLERTEIIIALTIQKSGWCQDDWLVNSNHCEILALKKDKNSVK